MSRLADISIAIQEWVASAVQTEEMAAALAIPLADIPDRLWDSTPPVDAPLPYLEMVVTEPRDVGAVGLAEVMAVSEVTVKVVGRVEAYEPIRPVAVAIHHALQGKTNVPLGGGGLMLSSERRRVVAYPEQTEGIEYRHLGGTYTVHAQ